MRAGCAIFASLGALVVPRLAAGQAAAPAREMLRLEWRAPVGCPSEKTVREAAIRSSGGTAPESTLDVRADVEHGARWRVTIQTSRDGAAAETRSLEAASCRALADATAVVLGVALIPAHALARAAEDPTDAAGRDAATTTAAAADEKAPYRSAAAADEKAPYRSAAAADEKAPYRSAGEPDREKPAAEAAVAGRPHFAVAAEFAGDAGVMPAVAAGARVAVAWTPKTFRVELSGAYFSGQSRTTGVSEAGARFGLLTIGGRGCWAALRGSVELGPCAGVDVQHMTAGGFGAPTNFDATGTWTAGALGGLVRIPITHHFALRADLDAVVPFTRPRFVVENDGAVHKPAGIGARAGIGAELNFL